MIIKDDRLLSYHLKNDLKNPEFDRLSGGQSHINPAFGMDESSHKRQYEDFVSAILDDREPKVTGEEALKSLSVIKKIYEASDKKQEIYM